MSSNTQESPYAFRLIQDADVEIDCDNQPAGQIRCTTSNGAHPRPAVLGLLGANSCRYTDGDQCERQTYAEAQDVHATQGEFFDLNAEQQNGDGRWARNELTRQAEHDDLSRGDLTMGEALTDIVGMGVLNCATSALKTLRYCCFDL